LVSDGSNTRATSSLLSTLCKEGEKYQQSGARLIYYHRVEKFDFKDLTKKIR